MRDSFRDSSHESTLERIMRIIPGYSGYKEKEKIRESDKRLREYLGQELDRIRKSVERTMRDLTEMNSFSSLDLMDVQVKRMQKYAENIRFASYGYAGFFSDVKIGEPELEEILSHDQKFIDSLSEIRSAVKILDETKEDESELKQSIKSLESVLNLLEEEIQKRKYLLK